jgi:hypothetical protein
VGVTKGLSFSPPELEYFSTFFSKFNFRDSKATSCSFASQARRSYLAGCHIFLCTTYPKTGKM